MEIGELGSEKDSRFDQGDGEHQQQASDQQASSDVGFGVAPNKVPSASESTVNGTNVNAAKRRKVDKANEKKGTCTNAKR